MAATCPITDILTVISAKWAVEILRELRIQPTRTRRFLVHIPGLTMKSLRHRLQIFEDFGLVTRTKHEGRVLHVEYAITDRGEKIIDLLEQIKKVADELSDNTPHCVCPMELDAEQLSCRAFECPGRRTKKGAD
jgi:DNA-binding HxlR family transcriptional regulator